MPRLPYSQSTPKLPQKVFTPESQGADVARAKGEFADAVARGGQQVGQMLEERRAQSEISKLNAEFATAQAELTVAWRERLATADPNDPEVAARFREEEVAGRLEALRDFASTREGKAYYQRASAGLSAGFLVSTEAGQQSLRETAAVQNWDTMLNQMSDAVIADPLSVDATMTMSDIQIEGLVQTAGLSREKALVLQTQARGAIAKGAATGLIMQDPAMGRTAVESGKYSEHLSAEEKSSLLRFADAQERAQEAALEKARKKAAGAAQVDVMKRAVLSDGTIDTSVIPQLQAEILRDPRLRDDPASLRATFNYLENLVDEGSQQFGKTDPAVFNDIMQRATLPPGDPRRPTRNEVLFLAGNGLKVSDANYIADKVIGQEGSISEQVRNELRSTKFKQASAYLTKSTNLDLVSDPGLIANYSRWREFAVLTEQEMLTEGKTPAEIWADDGPIMSRLPEFNQRLSQQQQIEQFRSETQRPGRTGEFPTFEGRDPTRFDTGKPDVKPELRTGPKLGATYKGKSLKELSPAEMDAWLKENQ